MATEREVSLAEFRRHLDETRVARIINEVVVHHTWRPTASDYRGIETVRGVRRYHTHVRGWSDNGYHVMIGPDGRIFLCRPMRRSGAHVAGRNAHTIGVSFIANFDHDEPGEYEGLKTGQMVVAALLDRFDLNTKAIRFHREFAPKTCPGTKLSLAAFRDAVADLRGQASMRRPKLVLLPGTTVLECNAEVSGGVARVDLRPVAEALGYRIYDHLEDQGKLYLAKAGEQ